MAVSVRLRGNARSPARHRRAGRKNDTDQVRRWREVFNEGAETPGAKIRGS